MISSLKGLACGASEILKISLNSFPVRAATVAGKLTYTSTVISSFENGVFAFQNLNLASIWFHCLWDKTALFRNRSFQPPFRLLWARPLRDAGWCLRSRWKDEKGRQQTSPGENRNNLFPISIWIVCECLLEYLTLHKIHTVSEVVTPHDLFR